MNSPHRGDQTAEGIPSGFVVRELVPARTPRTEQYDVSGTGMTHGSLDREFQRAAVLTALPTDGLARGSDSKKAPQRRRHGGNGIEVRTLVVAAGDEMDACRIPHAFDGEHRRFRRGRLRIVEETNTTNLLEKLESMGESAEVCEGGGATECDSSSIVERAVDEIQMRENRSDREKGVGPIVISRDRQFQRGLDLLVDVWIGSRHRSRLLARG